MKIKNLCILMAAALVLAGVATGCKKQSQEAKTLVLYYSQTGTTKAVAEEISQKLGADIEEIVVEEPYDGDYQQTIERGRIERENGIIPEIKPLESNLDDYDVILLGYPVWFGTYALPVQGLLHDYDLSSKRIVPFCTFGSGGLENSVADLRKALPQAQISNGYGVRSSRLEAMPAEVERFLIQEGLKEGELEELPDYSAQEPVTDEDAAIFEEACSGYRFPFGVPVSVGQRQTKEGTDYRFVAVAAGPDSTQTVMFIVYVTAPEGGTAEFTRVER